MAVKSAPPAPERGKLQDHVGEVLVFEPLAVETIETPGNPESATAEVVQSTVFSWNGSELMDLGDHPVFWARVKAQLLDSVGTEDVVVGKLVRKGNPYVLEAVSAETIAKIEAALLAEAS